MFKLNKLVNELLNEMGENNSLNMIDDNDPIDSDTLGSLCEKLSSVSIQMWHNQEILYKIRKMTTDEFINKYKDKLSDLHVTIKRCCDLNYQRSLLMDAIDKQAARV